MVELHKSGELKAISITDLRTSTTKNCKKLIAEIEKLVGKNLSASCVITSIEHREEIKAKIKTIHSNIKLEDKEQPGKTLERKDEPTQLQCFSYDQLKKTSTFNNGVYRGKLYGTITLSFCKEKVDCPDCTGTGTCSNCEGNKQVTCPVCDGDLECVSCTGTGIYTCENCDGDGVCPECDNGWISCNSCLGNGTVDCQDCGGTGDYINEECNRCSGSGYDYNGNSCKVCHGSGRFIKKCYNCDGTGTVDCDNCDGEGGWTCEDCHGSGNCSHCHGEGGFTCKACDGSGTCGKCRGKGKIWCPECHGKGLCFNCKGDKLVICPRCNGTGSFQSFKEYSFEENINETKKCSMPELIKHLNSIKGISAFKGTAYEMFAQKSNVYEIDAILKKYGTNAHTLKKWLSADGSGELGLDNIGNDYMNKYIESEKIYVTTIGLRCISEFYQIYIVGSNRLVLYDDLPSFGARFFGRFSKFFNKN